MPDPREQFNCRIPVYTKNQIAALAERMGLSQSEVLMLAIDRLAHASGKPKKTPNTRTERRDKDA